MRAVCERQSAFTQESMLAADLEFSLVRCSHNESSAVDLDECSRKARFVIVAQGATMYDRP